MSIMESDQGADISGRESSDTTVKATGISCVAIYGDYYI